MLLLISGEIDLSVGMVAALAPFLLLLRGHRLRVPVIPAHLLALVIAAGFGFVNGFVVTYFRVPSFVATLGSFFAIQGIMLTISDAYPAADPGGGQGQRAVMAGPGQLGRASSGR